MRLWLATTASGLATWALPFLLGLALLEGDLTAPELGLVLGFRTAGFLVAVPIGGILADRWPRRQVLLITGLLAALATPAVAVGVSAALPLALLAALVVGAGQGACRPAFQALTAEVVDEDNRQRANAAITLAVRVSVLIAPGVCALLSRVVDARLMIMATAALWVVAALLPPQGSAAEMRKAGCTDGAQDGPRGMLADFRDGLREARRHRWLLAGLGALAAVVATGYSVTGVLLPQVSRDTYGGETVLAGALMAYAGGALVGALLLTRWRPRSPGWTALAGLACYALAPFSLMLSAPPAVVIAAYAAVGLGIELFNVPWFTAIQREVPRTHLARVSSLDFLVSYGLAPLGLALIAPAAQRFGGTGVLAACGLACLLAPGAAALVRGSRHFTR